MLLHFPALPPSPSRSPPLRPFSADGCSSCLLLLRHRRRRRQLMIVLRSAGGGGRDRWKLTDVDPDAVQERLRSWLLKARTLINEVVTPLVKPGQGREVEKMAIEEVVFVTSEMTVDRRTPNGFLSLAAAFSIEQFGRIVQDERFDGAADAEDIQNACPQGHSE